MEKIKIELNGKKYEIKEFKAREWRRIAEFHEKKSEIGNVEYIEKHAEMIANFFEGLSVEEVLDNMDLSDVLKTYYDCHNYVREMIFEKMKTLDSTKGDGEGENQ